MIDFSSWSSKEIKAASLLLDSRNPRLPEFPKTPSERELIAALIEHEDVVGLARQIVDRGGLYPNEHLVAVEEDGSKIVLEGNRRLAALKLLDSPDLAPEQKVKHFRTLKQQIPPQAIEKVRVVFAPSREAAAPLIADRHTGNSIKKWERIQQARFIRLLVGPGSTIEQIAKQLGMTAGDIAEILRTDTMFQVASVMPVDEDVRQALQQPRSFNFSMLERFIESAAVQKFLGIAFAADGSIAGHIPEEEFKKGFARIVTDIARGNENTRSLNTKKEIQAYLDGLAEDTPNRLKKGTFTSESLLSGKTMASERAKRAASPKVAAVSSGPKVSPYLVPRNFRCRLNSSRIRQIFTELRGLKTGDHPNALAVLLRMFLELVISHHLDATGKIEPLLQTAKAKSRGNDWYPSLKQMLAHVLKDPEIKLLPMPKRALNKMLSDDEHYLSLDHLDAFVHNKYAQPGERELRGAWAALEPLLVLLMDDPAPTKK